MGGGLPPWARVTTMSSEDGCPGGHRGGGHDLAHTPGWDIVKEADGTVVTTAPDGTTWRRRPDRCQPEGRPAEPPPAAASEPGTSDASAATLFIHAA